MRTLRYLLCLISIPAAISCAGEISPTARLSTHWKCASPAVECRSIFVVHDAWHAAIVVHRQTVFHLPELADLPDARFIEFSWGDKDYFPDPEAGVLTALKAAFWSSGSVIHMVGVNENLRSFYHRANVVEVGLSAPAYTRLIDYISRSFARSGETGRAPPSPGLFSYSRFYPSTEKFSLLNTCNTWVAHALRFAGLPLSPGLVMTAGQLAEQLDKIEQHR